MRIVSAEIENYKSFLKSDEIHFAPGFNVIVGQNNVGKTALVEAIALRSGDKPHRSPKTIQSTGRRPSQASLIKVSFELTNDELAEMFWNLQLLHVPVVDRHQSVESNADQFSSAISDKNVIRVTWRSGELFEADFVPYAGRSGRGTVECIRFTIEQSGTKPELVRPIFTSADYRQTFPFNIAGNLRDRIYLFNAERLNLSKSAVGVNPNLAPNAANLAEVLNRFHTRNQDRFERLNEAVRQIFPDIRRVTAPMESAQGFYILVWTTTGDLEREDLAIELSESGTGIGQVLAMLYVVMSSDSPRIIIIDEPQSFLHPGAVRKLFDILREQRIQHQYIITTHSPTAVMAAEAQMVVLVRKPEAESVVEALNMTETNSLRLLLSEVGARLSDVFGADSILWVEGQTEELCFPPILSKIADRRLFGTVIIGVLQTGDFAKKKDAEAVFDIYKRLSTGRGLLPPAVGFIFDQEGRTQQEQQDLARKSKGAVHFLPRRMYECYLLNPQAIAAAMSSIEGFRDTPVTTEEVKTWLERHQWDKKYFGRTIPEEERTPDLWSKNVHAAQLLENLFSELSETQVNYDKVEYGVALTNWILENCPGDMKEIAELIIRVLDSPAVSEH